MTDVNFSSRIQDLLSGSGYKTSSIALDEDGNSHKITFESKNNEGEFYTKNSQIIYIGEIYKEIKS